MKGLNRRFTAVLWIVLILLIFTFWSLFISGPNRVHEQVEAQNQAKIEKKVKGIQGLTTHVFDYKTYQGYTKKTLYWFNVKGNVITTRKMSTLNYSKAKKVAKNKYGIKADEIVLGYGYNNPCYVITGDGSMILIDYDTFVRVYERGLSPNE